MNKAERIKKIEKWLQSGMSQEIVQDLKHYYKLDKYSLEELFTDDELNLLNPETSDLKIEVFKPLYPKQDWLQFRLSVYTDTKTLLISRTLPPMAIVKNKQENK